MSESQHPAMTFVPIFKDLAEGRLEPSAWIDWWAANGDAVKEKCLPGWFIRLKPQLGGGHGLAWTTCHSQTGAFYVLDALAVAHDRSDRYEAESKKDFERFLATDRAKKALLAKQYEPILTTLKEVFPKLARFLKKQASGIQELKPPATKEQITQLEQSISVPLPGVYKGFLGCCSELALDGLSLGINHTFPHPATINEQNQSTATICIADYFLEADGDQVLLARINDPNDDAPVYYCCHESPNEVKRLANTFTDWLESLPKSPVFRISDPIVGVAMSN